MRELSSTIAAIATPPGTGGIAVIRLSGADAFPIAARVFRPRDGKALLSHAPRTAVYGDILFEKEPIDDGVCILYAAPRSYTGEDTVELSCHGGVLVTKTVLAACLAAGAVPAEGGEFTRRAFMAGKLSLSDAEAIGTLLAADTHAQLALSGTRARNRLQLALDELHTTLVSVMASLFAAIDFPDEDLAPLSRDDMRTALLSAREGITVLKATYRTGKAVNEGVKTVICGKPNVGKSTLYNLLAGEELAIVTDIEGTTRDVLTARVSLGRVLLSLSDTAGLRKTADPVEKLGVERSRHRMEEAELCLAVFDASRPVTQEDRDLVTRLKALPAVTVAIINKTDVAAYDLTELLSSFPYRVEMAAGGGTPDLAPLQELINRLFTDEALTIGNDAILAGARQYRCVAAAEEALTSAMTALESGLPEDAVAGDIERAIAALGETDGRAVNEEVVASIFAHFCVGK